jgi:DNA-binding SARP family transcriptional activator
MLEFRVLGPLEVDKKGALVSLGGQKQRTLLAFLLIQVNDVVSADVLIDGLWGERPPVTVKTSLQNLVAQLRKALGASSIQTRGPGYVLEAEPGHIDASRFEQLVVRARQESASERVETLDAGLRLWRGAPYGDVFYESFAQAEIGRLEELRVTALEDSCAAKLETGLATELVPALRKLVELYPYRERLRQQLMLALYRSGRGVEALRTYIEWRTKVVQEWSTEPGRAIEQTAEAIRHLNPELDEIILWRELGRPRAAAGAQPSSNLLSTLELDQAMSIMEATHNAASGLPDGLDELDDARIETINTAVLQRWHPESG